jgi:LETM1 and EF-hand domain-containing protein 1
VKAKNALDKSQMLALNAIKSLVSMIAKTPGVMYYYTTHPTEFKEKLTELKELAKKEAHHYYMGSKLLVADVRTAKQIVSQTLNGSPLSRRERKQLLRTVTDVFRLVPMSIFVLIPFMEFALPLALKIFPNMLPSTFQDSLKAEENMKRELKSRLAMAEFFQE